MKRTKITNEDIGKRVVNSSGEKVGEITDVRAGTAHVDVDSGLTDRIRSKLGWGETDENDYTLREDRISTIMDEEVRLKNHQ